MKTIALILGLLCLSSASHAVEPSGAPASSIAKAPSLVDAEVRKIDAANGKLTLKHDEIPSLDMPPMTMVFQVRDKPMLDGLKVGDKVRFRAVDQGGGRLMIIAIQPQN